MSKGRNLLFVLIVMLGGIAGSAAPAMAHNVLTDSAPADGAEVTTAPDEVELRFLASLDEDDADLAVTGPDGASVVAGDPVFDGAQVRIPIEAPLAGDYEVSFDVLSADGHWVDGTVEFTVTEGDAPAEPTPEPTTAEPTPTLAPATPTPAADAAEADGVPGWAWWVVVVLVVAGAGIAGAGWLLRRRAG